MTILNATEARTNLYRIMEQVADSHHPVTITGKRSNSVLISEDDWLSAHYPSQIQTFEDYIKYSNLIKPFVKSHV